MGDPPLFLGYLKGVPFWWIIEQCWPIWLLGVGVLLGVFFVADTLNFRRAPKTVRDRETAHEEWRFEGLGNLFFLAVVLGAVFVNHPPFLREAIMAAAAAGSYLTTKKPVHEANDFNFEPIKEVAILFAGIFATMMPALDWLQNHATALGAPTPSLFFWGSGALSSVLDNAPTYLSFLSTAFGAVATPDSAAAIVTHVKIHGADMTGVVDGPQAAAIGRALPALARQFPRELLARTINSDQVQIALLLANPLYAKCLQAISIASVFFGANTYIGNGPNFMVKSIAERHGVEMPSFGGYLLYSTAVLLPIFVVVTLVFFG